jgi:NitT/TauT family transport system permease protein
VVVTPAEQSPDQKNRAKPKNVVGEMIASGRGLGYVLVLATTSLNMPLAFAALTLLLLLGMILFISFDILERRMAPWAFRSEA